MFLYYESLVLMNSFYHKLPDQLYLPLIPICFQLAPNAFLRQVIFLPASFNMLLIVVFWQNKIQQTAETVERDWKFL